MRMFATLVSDAPSLRPGDLVLVQVPPNCTVHSQDAARLGRLRTIAAEIRGLVARGDLPDEAMIRRLAESADDLSEDDEREVRRPIAPEVMRGIQLMRRHLDLGGHDWREGTAMADVQAARSWLDAAKADES